MANKDKKTAKPAFKSTQSYLRVSEIRSDTLVMDDGTLRSVVAVSTTNFDLKNQEEQDALIVGYQRFLNSLDFPVQILVQSRKIEIGDYIEKLKQMMEKQTNELLRIQTGEYIEFISRLVETANIMNKAFYIVVPLHETITPSAPGFFARLFTSTQQKQVEARLSNLEKFKLALDERVASVISNLSSAGLRSVRMNTEQLIELLYASYNFESAPTLNASKLVDLTVENDKEKEDAKLPK